MVSVKLEEAHNSQKDKILLYFLHFLLWAVYMDRKDSILQLVPFFEKVYLIDFFVLPRIFKDNS